MHKWGKGIERARERLTRRRADGRSTSSTPRNSRRGTDRHVGDQVTVEISPERAARAIARAAARPLGWHRRLRAKRSRARGNSTPVVRNCFPAPPSAVAVHWRCARGAGSSTAARLAVARRMACLGSSGRCSSRAMRCAPPAPRAHATPQHARVARAGPGTREAGQRSARDERRCA
jgi:hypothetical protein